jgi:hypothetical protein
MTRRTDNERLLADVIAGESDAAFHEALLGDTLRLARRRRRFRQARQAVVVVAVLVGLVALVWQSFPPRAVTPGLDKGSYAIIRTQPLPASSLVTTQPLAADWLVASFTTANVVETSPDSGLFRVIGDDELLAMVAPKVAALVRYGPHTAELIVLEPAGQDLSPPN